METGGRGIGNLKANYDVVVVGGGPAGICAAAQAALLGASTLCVEKYGILGGTMVAAGVEFPGLFHAYGRQVIAGIGWDLVRRSAELAGRPLPDFTREYGEEHWRHHVSISAPIFAALADQRVLDSGADLLFHAMPAAAEPAPDGWSLTLCLKEGLRKTAARILIDCTGDANLAALAGCEVRRSPRLQPATLMMKVGGYDLEALDLAAIERAFAEAVSRGEISRQDLSRTDQPCRNFLAASGRNRNHVPDVDAWDSSGKTQAEVAGRSSMLRILRFFKRQPGLEHFRIESCAMECGVRETRTIAGDVQVTERDYLGGRAWPDAVCYSFYPIDIHRDDGLGIDIRQPDRGVCPTVPRGCMLPAGSRGLLAAGRCVSSDKAANSALRTQPSCMAMGQAAGAMAALAAKTGRDVRELPIASIRTALRDHGAIVPKDAAG